MKLWIARPWLLAVPAVSLLAAPAGAQSVTVFGSIIITSMGNEGMSIQVPEGTTVSTTTSSEPVFTPDGKGGGTTTSSGGVIDIKPTASTTPVQPGPADADPGVKGTGTAASGPTDPVVSEVPPLEEIPLEDNPFEENPVTTTDDTIPSDVPPPTVDDPLMTTVDVPAVPPATEDLPSMTGEGVMDTPEPATLTLLALGGVGALVARRKRRVA